MPQGEESFWNPYRMVVVRDEKPEKKEPVLHHTFKGISGAVKCRITTLTPFLIGKRSDNRDVSFLEREGKPVIPGTSLKGMIRSLAELAGNGCAVVGKSDYKHKPCSSVNSLCITCRIFGMMEQCSNAKVFMGKISFGDGIFQGDKPVYGKHQILMGTPSPRHTAFYKNPDTNENNKTVRKLYFHQPGQEDSPIPPPPGLIERAWQVHPLPKNSIFEFEVTFQNLCDEELDLLLYCLALEEDVTVTFEGQQETQGPLRHKLGYGKPLGMGSVHIEITQLTLIDMAKRYRSLAPPIIFEKGYLTKEIEGRTKGFKSDASTTMTMLRKMLLYNSSDTRDFHWPYFNWFRDTSKDEKPKPPRPENSETPLKRI